MYKKISTDCKKNKRNLLISVIVLVVMIIITNLFGIVLDRSHIARLYYALIMLWARYSQSVPLAFVLIYLGRLIKNHKDYFYRMLAYILTFGGYLMFILPLLVTIIAHFIVLDIHSK